MAQVLPGNLGLRGLAGQVSQAGREDREGPKGPKGRLGLPDAQGPTGHSWRVGCRKKGGFLTRRTRTIARHWRLVRPCRVVLARRKRKELLALDATFTAKRSIRAH